MTNQEICPFCEIGAGRAPATFIRQWDDVFAIVPLGPVTLGHTLIIPRTHVRDFTDSLDITQQVMYCAGELARDIGLRNCNLITSMGEVATQSVFHLHVHLVPRSVNDRLALPWHSGKTKATETA